MSYPTEYLKYSYGSRTISFSSFLFEIWLLIGWLVLQRGSSALAAPNLNMSLAGTCVFEFFSSTWFVILQFYYIVSLVSACFLGATFVSVNCFLDVMTPVAQNWPVNVWILMKVSKLSLSTIWASPWSDGNLTSSQDKHIVLFATYFVYGGSCVWERVWQKWVFFCWCVLSQILMSLLLPLFNRSYLFAHTCILVFVFNFLFF